MHRQEKKSISLFALTIIFITCALVINSQVNRPEKLNVIAWDIQEYYMYLPAAFIYGDMDFSYVKDLPDSLKKYYWLGKSKIGKNIGRMSVGMAVSYSPFFFFGHAVAKIFNFPQTGYSYPYQLGVFISGFFYSFMGFIFLRKLLLKYFSDVAVALTLLCTALGTNLFYYSTTEGPMSHAVLFGLFSVFLYYTICWHQNPTYKNIAIVFFTAGLAILIRPISIMLAIIFLLYGLSEKNALKNKLNIILKKYKHFLLGFIILLLIALPQLLLWKSQTGDWIYYSYGNERFFFTDPKIFEGFFSYRKGWLLYTPVMLLSLIGFFFLYKKNTKAFLAILLYVVLHIFVIFSWWCWWYGGSFGMRAMIEVYAFLTLPLAALWHHLWKEQKTIFIVAFLFAGGCVYLNQRQTLQYRQTIIHWDSMNKAYYWAVFNKLDWPAEEKTKLLTTPDYEAAMKGERDL